MPRGVARVTVLTWAAAVVVAAAAGCGAPARAPGAATSGAQEDVLWSAPSDQALPAQTARDLQQALDTYLENQDAPGATAAVVSPAGTWAGASGVDGVGTPLLPSSASAIASITKTFVAAEVLLLSARGQVELDAAVADYVDLPFDTAGATVREVLGMESGFPQDPSDRVVELGTDPEREWAADDVLALVVDGTHEGVRGGDPRYNNLNYYALGAMVEEVAGEPLAAVLRRDLFDPAGLERVWFQTSEVPVPPLAIAAGRPGLPAVDLDGPYLPSRAMASAAGAAGGMAADAPTVARWGHVLYRGALVDPSLVREMTAPDDDGDWYGLGTMLAFSGGEVVVGHEGDIGVYHSLLAVWPETATSVAVLVPGAAPRTVDEDRRPLGLARALHRAAGG